MRYAIIPARGGSKRIPRKNIRLFAGKPMICHSIDTARASGLFDAVIVSTDDAEIAEIARGAGAEVPFVRPNELSDDHATSVAVAAHGVDWLLQAGRDPREVCLYYATAPFVQVEDLKTGLAALTQDGARFAFPVTTFASPIQRALARDSAGGLVMREPQHIATRSQDLPDYFHDTGQFYWGLAKAWLSGAPIFSPFARGIEIPRYRVQDIDTPDDWRRAEIMLEALMKSGEMGSTL